MTSKNHLFVFFSVFALLFICGCDPDDVTIYNNYEGNPNDSSGYYNIFYHDFEPDIVLDSTIVCSIGSCNYVIDFNNNGEFDNSLTFRRPYCDGGLSSNSYFWIGGSGTMIADINCVSQVQGTNGNTQNIPFDVQGLANLQPGFLIQSQLDPNSFSWKVSNMDCGFLDYFVLPCNSFGTDIYLGLKSDDGANSAASAITSSINFGWMKVGVSADGKVLTLKEYAYNLIPNSPIRVGDK